MEEWGNLEAGFKEAERIFEGTYVTKHVNNAQMERRVSLAKWDNGKLTVWASTQGISKLPRGSRQRLGIAAE